jgi:hypothetical protein
MKELIKRILLETAHNKLSLDTFINRSKESHGDKYDYSQVEYKNQYEPVKIICPIHGEFLQIPKSHMNGMGCKKCGIEKQSKSRSMKFGDFIRRAILVHNDKYNYDKVDFKKSTDKIIITCPKHGDFQQQTMNHLQGAGCKKCADEKLALKQRTPLNIFIDQSEKIHDNKYDYFKVKYLNNRTKVDIICSEHGVFSQTPNAHLRGQGCPICGREKSDINKRLTTDEFIKRAKNVHGNKFDYSESVYSTESTPIKIICKKHGPFFQTPYNHFGNKQGCPICGKEKTKEKLIKTTDDFINDAILVHRDRYDYSLVDYKGNKKPVTIVCKKHGPFNQIPSSHLAGQGCPICANNIQKTTQEFIDDAIKIHGNKYDYSLVKYKNSKEPVTVICPKHGNFNTLPINHLKGVGCPICSESKGERLVSLILERNQIGFERQKKFDGCFRIGINNKRCYKLPFDFYLPTYNTVIEYDGLQHFRPVGIFGGEKAFQQNKLRDELKTLYCRNNNIRIIRIPYTMKNNDVESFIKKELGITS